MRLQAGDEVHVILRQNLQQRIERLAELRVVLRGGVRRSHVISVRHDTNNSFNIKTETGH